MRTGFFAMLSRMKYINRWGLMRNSRAESLSEHTLDVAMIAHALAVIRNRRFGGRADPAQVALLALYHDAHEIITGDLPTPVKYLNDEIRGAYKNVEHHAAHRLLAMLPDDMQGDYTSLLLPGDDSGEALELVKAADKLSALIKCMEEECSGNGEFKTAKEATLKALAKLNLPEAQVFLEQFIPAYECTLDELN
ncbi:MAG: 5'-deoxynucleotidase [Acetanaerobacterium sp.]